MAAALIAHSAADVLPSMSREDALRYDGNEWFRHVGVDLANVVLCDIQPYARDPEFVFITIIRDGIADGMHRPMRRPYALEAFSILKVNAKPLVWRSEPTKGYLHAPWFPSKEASPRISPQVYFIACRASGLVKIGRAVDVDSRLAQLQSMSPVPLELLGSMDGAGGVEGALHRRFRKHRHHGEWFAMAHEIMEFINDHCN